MVRGPYSSGSSSKANEFSLPVLEFDGRADLGRRSDDWRVKMQNIAIGGLHVDVALRRKSTAFVVATDDSSSEVKPAVSRDARGVPRGGIGQGVGLWAQKYCFENSCQARRSQRCGTYSGHK